MDSAGVINWEQRWGSWSVSTLGFCWQSRGCWSCSSSKCGFSWEGGSCRICSHGYRALVGFAEMHLLRVEKGGSSGMGCLQLCCGVSHAIRWLTFQIQVNLSDWYLMVILTHNKRKKSKRTGEKKLFTVYFFFLCTPTELKKLYLRLRRGKVYIAAYSKWPVQTNWWELGRQTSKKIIF